MLGPQSMELASQIRVLRRHRMALSKVVLMSWSKSMRLQSMALRAVPHRFREERGSEEPTKTSIRDKV